MVRSMRRRAPWAPSLRESGCSRSGETQNCSAAMSNTSPEDLGETVAPDRRGYLRSHNRPHDRRENLDACAQGETQRWAWSVHAFVAWLATMLGYTTRFKRDQLIAQGVAQLLAGQLLQLDDTKIQLTPPATYGGPCPRTPFDMNRRFIALARWSADREAIIRERFKRRSRLVAHGSTDARSAATHEEMGAAAFNNAGARAALMVVSSDRRERQSNHEGALQCARGPAHLALFPTTHTLSAPARLRWLAFVRTRTCLQASHSRRIPHADATFPTAQHRNPLQQRCVSYAQSHGARLGGQTCRSPY